MAKPTIKQAQRRSSTSLKRTSQRARWEWDWDILAVSIPTSALTLDGFCAWYQSDDFPPYVRISYLGSELYVELDPEEEAVQVPISAGTLEGFRAWATSKEFPERGRISYLGQEVFIDMSPENVDWQSEVKTEIARVIGNLVCESDVGKFYTDGPRISNPEADISNVPDGVFAAWETLTSGRLRRVPAKGKAGGTVELAGTPDWVMEIISPSSVRKDTKELREKYHRAGIREYWLIDVRGDEIQFQILRYRSAGYVAVARRGGWQKSPVFGRSFRLERRRDRLGSWQYRLLVNPA